jgi:energy-coupling factor transport system permease protein
MENLELLRYVTIGQYLPTGSPIHRLDPRVKLLGFGALVLAVAFNGSYLGNLVMLATVLGLVALARVPLAYTLQGIRPALPIILVLAALQILLPPPAFSAAPGCAVLISWRCPDGSTGSPQWFVEGPFLQVTDCTLRLVVVSALRFGELIILTSLLTLCTPITDLSRGIERLLAPLARLRFPAHEMALVLTIALRFVPVLAQEMERIVRAQVSRGADFGGRSRLRFIRQTRQLLPLLVPLFLISLRRAEELALAMDVRCYTGGTGRTHLVRLRARPSDFVALGLIIAFAVLILSLDFNAADRALLPGLAPHL